MNINYLNSNSGIISGEKLTITSQFTELSLLHESDKGYSRLYKGKRFGKWHILKTLKKEYADNILYQGLLQKEFEIAYPLSHPNIVQTIGFEEISNLGLCIVMEYLDGTNLREYLSENKENKKTVIKIITNLCSALDYIHAKQITHRDLKPENIFITRNGTNVKLIDFGLSDSDSYVILKQPAGTLGYASPEQQNGDLNIDNRADIYSLGVILEEIRIVGLKLPRINKIISLCKTEERTSRFSSVNDISILLNQKIRSGYYLLTLLVLTLIFGGTFLGYRNGFKNAIESINYSDSFPEQIGKTTQNFKKNNVLESLSNYNLLANKAKTLANQRCKTLYDKYDSTKYNQLWWKEYSNLVRDVNQQVDSLLKIQIPENKPEYNLYKTSLFMLVEDIWIDYCYRNQSLFAKQVPANDLNKGEK